MHSPSIQAEVPPVDNCCEKELFAFFGLVAYSAQVLEHSALNLALVLKLAKVGEIAKRDFYDIYENLTKHTFGRLITSAKKLIQISEDQERILKDAVDLRNHVTHHYFRERAEDFVSIAGQSEMKKEMQKFIARFKEADQLMTSLYQPLWNEYGVTEEYVDTQMEKLLSKAQERDRNA